MFIISILWSCSERSSIENSSFPAPSQTQPAPTIVDSDKYYDKILGMIVGSAIGDAMGAPVEMWSRRSIQVQYGYIDTLVLVARPDSPEGPWEDYLQAGATTDDTRWKYLISNYLSTQSKNGELDASAFAKYIIAVYEQEKEEVQQVESFSPEPLEKELLHMTWLQEWAKVAQPFLANDIQAYNYALNKFYGGDLACAGMLYSPSVGVFYPGNPNKAYEEAYRIGIFDHGYARDIMALTAAYTSMAMGNDIGIEDIVDVTLSVDPMRYNNSRLVGRLANNALTRSKEIMFEVQQLKEDDILEEMTITRGFKGDKLEYARLMKAYELLEGNLKDIPFHAEEIHQINIMALLFSNGDFRKAMEFIVNFGRDNDTVAAVTGAILGAQLGYSQLPQPIASIVLKTSRDVMGMDLEKIAISLSKQNAL